MKMSKLSDFNLGEDCAFMTLDEWKACVAVGSFIDYDGFGLANIGDEVFDKPVYPSEADDWNHDTATHILWFNK